MFAPTTYARARLRLGILGVGTWVLVAAALLTTSAHVPPLERLQARATEALVLLGTLALFAVVALPFDLVGGYVLPRRYGRRAPTLGAFARGWLRGATVLLAVSTSCGVALIAAGRAGGVPLAMAVFVLLQLVLVAVQLPLARVVGGLRASANSLPSAQGSDGADVASGDIGNSYDRAPEPSRADTLVLRGEDEGFTGGIVGLGGTLVVPERWTRDLDPRALSILVERRRSIVRRGARRRAFALAIAWNTAGFALALAMTGPGVTSVAALVSTALGFTLWSFVGLLLLPALTRRATRAADAAVATDDGTRADLERAIRSLDRLQDDEPARTAAVESVFHPTPSVRGRLAALPGGVIPSGPGPWHLARTALFLGHAGLSLLPRAVHCNTGRPELWVLLPTDG